MDTGTNEKMSWLGYGAEILTVFFALIVLTGRVYAQSYWNVFGLAAQQIDNNFLNYAIMSPNVAVASVLMAVGTICIVSMFRNQLPDLIGNKDPQTSLKLGFVVLSIGLVIGALILGINTSAWTSGTPGMVFGLANLFCLAGVYVIMLARSKLNEKEVLPKYLAWLKNTPAMFVQVFFILIFVGLSFWGITDMAHLFGTNEAKEAYITSPVADVELNSPKGFENIATSVNPDGNVVIKVKILVQANEFLYVSPGGNLNPPQLDIRAIPVSQVQAIDYSIGVTPIGK